MKTVRPILALCLALVLSLTSVTMAVARGQATGGMSMVICSGYGVVTITVDEHGNPAGPVHPCPDCLSGLGLAVLGDAPMVPWPQVVATRIAAVDPGLPEGSRPPMAKARGPPAAV